MLRDPVDVVLSHANYVASRISLDPGADSPDVRHWLDALGWAPLSSDLGHDRLRDLAGILLMHPAFMIENTICRYLGDGDAVSAEERILLSDIEMTDVRRYPQWLQEEFGLDADAPINDSRSLLHRETLSAAQQTRVMTLTEEDRKLYARIEPALDGRLGQRLSAQCYLRRPPLARLGGGRHTRNALLTPPDFGDLPLVQGALRVRTGALVVAMMGVRTAYDLTRAIKQIYPVVEHGHLPSLGEMARPLLSSTGVFEVQYCDISVSTTKAESMCVSIGVP